ncbi:MAG TPA: trypsin-like peptidase domain-containing protein [Pirellulaceae bacterium]|nr:trypsin-like peptidase domain-containing protein [Pirellulaceae bacterium]HMO93355.1 trypsin-like peptidase domain-containing protein [Pirellulaceae bacterium]HMP70126.1 trypsin-like peptidase domain-containing protein [Pirellulaceae bacterium]
MAQSIAPTDLNAVFRDAIEIGQKRSVKVYGATAGRVDGYASGIIVSPDGKILTMQGVFLEGSNLRVGLADGTIHEAVVLRRNRELQIALLQIAASTPDYFEITDADVADKGDWVVALSNAFKVADGDEPLSVNLGVVTLRTTMHARLTPRDVAFSGPMVLIDAIISNPGAAGGPVVTQEGLLVGMIGKVINSSDTNTRLNYAIPTSALYDFIHDRKPDVAEHAVVESRPGDLGIHLFRLGGVRSPAYIDRVRENSPASEVGLKPDDLIMHINGHKIATVNDYDRVLSEIRAGDEVILVVARGDKVIRIPLIAVEKQ